MDFPTTLINYLVLFIFEEGGHGSMDQGVSRSDTKGGTDKKST